jgi:transcriptional regulator with XRE-family HTH domain
MNQSKKTIVRGRKMVKAHDYIKEINTHIGNKIYSLRLIKGLSRQQLAEKINITQQQVKKYEDAENRVTISTLILIAKALDSKVDYFYKDLHNEELNIEEAEMLSAPHKRLCIEVSRNFRKMNNLPQQEAINKLIKALIKCDK